jgi:hypothetical protein
MFLSVFHWLLLGIIECIRLMEMCTFKQAAREADVAARLAAKQSHKSADECAFASFFVVDQGLILVVVRGTRRPRADSDPRANLIHPRPASRAPLQRQPPADFSN